GYIEQVNGLTRIVADSVAAIGKSAAALAPRQVSRLNESLEARLVVFSHARLINPAQWVASGSGFTGDITNGKDTLKLYIANVTDLFNHPAPAGRFITVTGIVTQDKNTSPYIGGYMLMPRGSFDIVSTPYPMYKIRQVKSYDHTSGIADSIQTSCYLKGMVYS